MLQVFHLDDEFALIENTDFLLEVYPKTSSGLPYSLAGASFEAIIRDFTPSPARYPITIVSDSLNNRLLLSLSRAQISQIPSGDYEWFLDITDTSGQKERYVEGRVRRR